MIAVGMGQDNAANGLDKLLGHSQDGGGAAKHTRINQCQAVVFPHKVTVHRKEPGEAG